MTTLLDITGCDRAMAERINTFAFAGPNWLPPYLAHVRRNANIAPKNHRKLIPLNYSVPVDSYEVGNLAGHEITLIAPGSSTEFQVGVARYLLQSGASLVVTVSDAGSISAYRGDT
jgi:hypothetical protein